MRRLSQPVNIENNRRSYVTSPRGNNRGTQSADFLGIPPAKVREFEQVTDISIDKLDEFNAQTQQTSKGLEGFGEGLTQAVRVIDTLTPALEGFGVDLTSQRSHGRLATNTGSGHRSSLEWRCVRRTLEYHQEHVGMGTTLS